MRSVLCDVWGSVGQALRHKAQRGHGRAAVLSTRNRAASDSVVSFG